MTDHHYVNSPKRQPVPLSHFMFQMAFKWLHLLVDFLVGHITSWLFGSLPYFLISYAAPATMGSFGWHNLPVICHLVHFHEPKCPCGPVSKQEKFLYQTTQKRFFGHFKSPGASGDRDPNLWYLVYESIGLLLCHSGWHTCLQRSHEWLLLSQFHGSLKIERHWARGEIIH
jgi:hypothetical protein